LIATLSSRSFSTAWRHITNPLVISNQKIIAAIKSVFMGRKPKSRRDRYGAWLVHLRNEAGLSQDQLSAKVGVPQSTLAYWERTGKLTGREIILKLSKTLGVSVEEFLRAK
jgi:ribosome-binding protein aMBF1 (putative translation factor)